MLNKVILIGRLANDPELKWTPSGIPVTTFRLAVDRPISAEARQAGQEKQADFIDIVAWRQAAEFASNYLGKGRLVAIEGRLQIRQYVAQDGTNRRVSEVVVDQLKSLDRPREHTDNGAHETDNGHHHREHYDNSAPRTAAPAPRPQQMASAPAARPQPAPARRPAADTSADSGIEQDPFADTDLDDPFADE